MINKLNNQKCKICNCACYGSICSNNKCKSWSKYKRKIKNIKIVAEPGTYENPYPINCPMCGMNSGLYFYINCNQCHNIYVPSLVDGMYYYDIINDKMRIAKYIHDMSGQRFIFTHTIVPYYYIT